MAVYEVPGRDAYQVVTRDGVIFLRQMQPGVVADCVRRYCREHEVSAVDSDYLPTWIEAQIEMMKVAAKRLRETEKRT